MLSTDKDELLYPILDGWMLRRNNRCDYTFQSLALAQYESLRRASALRQKQWAIPSDVNAIPIPAFDCYEYQLDVGVGAVIWGYSWVGPTDTSSDVSPFATMSWQIRDACDDQAFFSEPMTREFNLSGTIGQTAFAPQLLLARPWVVGKPGLLNIVITSMFPTPKQGQLILYGGVPARATSC
ncbi:MAG: hypothetical protein IVW54_16890 [Candidatus Binataceae bacterium]|nr:hypothetical protein [Candidatus Binataceae bacterium]